jgi:hypothetical protein
MSPLLGDLIEGEFSPILALPRGYLITLSALADIFGGIVRSTCFAISKSITTIEYRRKLN